MKINPEEIPYGYAYCFATGEQCPQREECLRALIAAIPLKAYHKPEHSIVTIDPRYIDTLQGKGNCTFYRSSAYQKYARGMSRMFDAVPSKVVTEVRRRVQNCFSCRSYYFSSRKGERLVSPDEQKKIAAVFQQFCPDIKPVYDEIEETYEW